MPLFASSFFASASGETMMISGSGLGAGFAVAASAVSVAFDEVSSDANGQIAMSAIAAWRKIDPLAPIASGTRSGTGGCSSIPSVRMRSWSR